MDNNERAILQALLYSDIFSYPLSEEDIWHYLPSIMLTYREYTQALHRLLRKKKISFSEGFYTLPGKMVNIHERKKRYDIAQRKLLRVNQCARILGFIPSVLFVGVSGGLAMRNTKQEDDIDIFIITREGTLWITRLCVLVLLSLMTTRRKHNSSYVEDMICPNMFIDETSLGFSSKDFYTAHEIVQVQPLIDRDNIYIRFLNANKWVEPILAHAFSYALSHNVVSKETTRMQAILSYLLRCVEQIAKFFQVVYMKRHKTTETVTDKILAFHPYNYKIVVLKEYEENLKRNGI